MPNRSTDALFQLVHSLEKSEKRNFKLYVQRNSSSEELKVVQLFDALDKMDDYDENALLKKNPSIKKQQLSNIKAHLYKQILASLRVLNKENYIDIELHEQMDHARILYNKGLYHQSLKVLDKLKETAGQYHQYSFVLQALFFEKQIESLHITRSMQDRAQQLAIDTEMINSKLTLTARLSNLSLLLYSWYINNGHARNEKDEKNLRDFFALNYPKEADNATGFYDKLYKYQCYCWFGFIRHDLLLYYKSCQKWVNLFEANPEMLQLETMHFVKGVHNLLTAHVDLKNYQKFTSDLKMFEEFSESPLVKRNINTTIQVFVYLHIAKINQYFLEGTFTEGLAIVPTIEEKLEEYRLYLDRHRVLVFYYKIASLYFGSGDYNTSIDYLNKIINWKVDLRTDLQCYSRLLHLIAHYELKNYDLLEYLFKSVYRFMAKMENLSVTEEEIFKFLRKSFKLSPSQLKPAFIQLLDKLKKHQHNPYETRAFMYLDVISWLESKIDNVPVQTIIRNKYLNDSRNKLKK
ncbi:hypothetical protein [Gynurincola endophyticus]|jgi:hypothetical protein|uniref:hypothetical protein n=1 Tax=Gynurincola endophyticus TaxID=2479004 RepID=UPI000F8E7795|nr:hypothetical protein [Gynurincola endophyticus]